MSGPDRRITALAAAVSVERCLYLAVRRPGRLLRFLTGRRERAEPLGALYWPVDFAAAEADVKLPLRAGRKVRLPIAQDGVTGRRGLLDIRMPERESVTVRAEEVISAAIEPDPAQTREYGRNQIVLRYRPTRIDGLRIVDEERLHLPYLVVRCGRETVLVERVTGRVDTPGNLPSGEAERLLPPRR